MTTVQYYPKVNLRDHALLIRGITFKPHQKTDIPSDDAIVCLRTANVQSNVDWRSLIYIPKALVKRTDKLLREKDILISTANSNNLVGKCCLIRSLQVPATLGGFISVIRANGESLDASYLYHYLNSDEIQALLRSISRQTTNISNLPTDQLLNVQIPLPPLPIQKRIAVILEKADAAREKRRQANALTEQFLQSAFLDMFGNPITNPKGWEKETMDELCDRITDGTHDTPKRLTQGVKFITGKNIRPHRIDFSNLDFVSQDVHEEIYRRCNPIFGDVLYTNIGVNLGTAVMNNLHEEFSMKNVALLKHNRLKLESRFLEYILNDQRMKKALLKRFSIGGAQSFLSLGNIKMIEIPVPPLSLQQKFAAMVEKVEAMRFRQRASEQELDLLFQALMQRAFKGELVS